MTPARKPTEGMASWPVAWVRTDLPRGRCERALRVSVVPRVGAYAAPRSLARSLMCSSLCLRSSASQAWACSRRLIRYRRTRNCGALRQGRSPSLEATAIPAHTSPPLLFVMSMGQFDHPFWFNARPMVTKIDAMSVSKQAHVRMGVDSTGDDWESPGLPTDISGKSVGFKRYRSSRWGETSQSHTTELPTTRA